MSAARTISPPLNRIINLKMIAYVLGILLWVEGAMFLVCMGVSLYFNEPEYIYFLITFGINFVLGLLLTFYGNDGNKWVTRRDGFFIVSLTWVLFSFMGMLPFWISGWIPEFTDAFFETMSGFTTTGASILNNIEELPYGLLFWRSLTQWIGGLGIVCFSIAVLPIFGGGNIQLFSAEATGVIQNKLSPKISTGVKWIWSFYLIVTSIVTLLLIAGPMSPFDAICHAFTAMGTGGYSTKQASIAHWNSAYIEYVLTFAMVIASFNFTYMAPCLQGKFKQLLNDHESRWFVGSVAILTVIMSVTLYVYKDYESEEAFRKAFFQVASIHSSTGFASDDYGLWPHFTWMFLLLAMVVGGCTGSTAGGIKNMRMVLLFKSIQNELKRRIHPNAVFPLRINQKVIPQETLNKVTIFTVFFVMCGFVGSTLLMIMGMEFLEAVSVTLSSLGNVGPAMGDYGPAFSWSEMPVAAKWLTSFMMLIGRLELFSVMVLFSPAFWKEW